jgi:hypothetical protein
MILRKIVGYVYLNFTSISNKSVCAYFQFKYLHGALNARVSLFRSMGLSWIQQYLRANTNI